MHLQSGAKQGKGKTEVKDSLIVGLKHQASLKVSEDLTVPKVSKRLEPFLVMPPVFATAFEVAFIEATCMLCIADHLETNEKTVGIHIDVSHSSATPIGMTVTCDVELIEINKRILNFKVIARDETDIIGQGTHKRAIIDPEKFEEALSKKSTPK